MMINNLYYSFDFRETFKSDYNALKKTLTTLPDKITHDIMVSLFGL
jgi:hypothetical protein